MKQYKITSENIPKDTSDDCYIDPADPVNELKIVQYLAGLGSAARLQEYRAKTTQDISDSNITKTASENARIMREQNIKPGTPEWFKLWFSKQFMTGEKPIN